MRMCGRRWRRVRLAARMSERGGAQAGAAAAVGAGPEHRGENATARRTSGAALRQRGWRRRLAVAARADEAEVRKLVLRLPSVLGYSMEDNVRPSWWQTPSCAPRSSTWTRRRCARPSCFIASRIAGLQRRAARAAARRAHACGRRRRARRAPHDQGDRREVRRVAGTPAAADDRAARNAGRWRAPPPARNRGAAADGDAPSLSVVSSPAFNEAERLPPVLRDSLRYLRDERAAGWELIVVDDGGTDGTADAVRGAASRRS